MPYALVFQPTPEAWKAYVPQALGLLFHALKC
jgi:hypothetical protein